MKHLDSTQLQIMSVMLQHSTETQQKEVIDFLTYPKPEMNKMKFDLAMSVLLSDKVITEMISKCVQEQTGRTVIGINYKIKETHHGDQRDSWTTSSLESATVMLSSEKTSIVEHSTGPK